MAEYALALNGVDQQVTFSDWVANGDWEIEFKAASNARNKFILAGFATNNGCLEVYHSLSQSSAILFYEGGSLPVSAAAGSWPEGETKTIRIRYESGAFTIHTDGVAGSAITQSFPNGVRVDRIGHRDGLVQILSGQIEYLKLTDLTTPSNSRHLSINEGSGTNLADSLGTGSTDGTFINPPGDDSQWVLLAGGGLTVVSNAVSIDWSMLAKISNGYQSLWNLLNPVSAQTSIKWDLLEAVSANADLKWSLIESVSNNVQFDWDLLAALAAVSNSAQVNWDLLQKASSSTELQWGLLNQISNNLGIEWDLLATVGSSVQLDWDLLSALVSVSNSVQFKWDLAGKVSAQLEAQWNLLESVGVSTELRWDLAVNVASQVQAQWYLLEATGSSIDLVWDSVAATSNGLEFRWSLQSESVRLPVHVMLVTQENRVMSVLAEDRIMKILN